MKCYVKRTTRTISIILLLCIIFNSFSGFTYTSNDHLRPDLQLSAHDTALKSLTEQLNSKGIGLYSITDEDIVFSPSGYDFRTRVSYEINEPLNINSNDDIIATITFKLSSSSNKDISFEYKIYPGSAFLYKHYNEVENGSITFEAGQTEKSIDITISKINNDYDPDNPKIFEYGELWTGDRVFFISCFGINNALFDNERETMSIPIRINNDLDLKQSYDRAKNTYMVDMSQIKNAESDLITPGKYVNTGDVINISTASAITADVRKMIDTGTFSHLNLPIGYFLNESGATGEVSLQIVKNDDLFPILDRKTAINENGEIDFCFFDDFSNDVPLGNLGIGSYYEANIAVKSIGISLNYSLIDGPVYTVFHDKDGNYVQNQMNFEDKIKPFPIRSEAPAGEFCLGESIPITVTFNEAILTDNIKLTANGSDLYPVERDGTISEDVTFLYEIGADFNNLIDIQKITGAIDLSDNEQNENMTHSNQISYVRLKSYTIEELLSSCAETEIVVSQGKSMNAEVEINLSLKANEELLEYLASHRLSDGRIKTVKSRVIGEDRNAADVDLYANDEILITELRGKFTAPASSISSDTNYIAEIYFDENDTNNFNLIYSLSKQYTLPQIIYIDNESDLIILYENWPVDNRISSNNTDFISLKYKVNNNATWQEPDDFVWESSDNTVASITTSGAISLTGKPGSVSFSLTALNSGQPEERFTIHSSTLQVIDTNEVFLDVSGWSKEIEIVKGNDAMVYYSTNIPANNEAETDFFYNLYEAEYILGEIKNGDLVVSDTQTFTAGTQKMYYEIDKQFLSKLSEKGKYSYILEISAKDEKTDMIITSSAYIRVKSLPAKAVLSKPDSYYITDDTQSFNVKFDIENYSPKTEVKLTVTKNESKPVDITEVKTFEIGKVDDLDLYDIYTVSLKAKNEYDEAYSYDSYVMYVYNSKALKISIDDDIKEENHTMSMDDKLEIMTSEEILNLNRNINLIDDISINTEYKWNRLFDKTKWSVSDDNILAVKYKNGGLLGNIDKNNLVSPNSQLSLEGLSPGKSNLTVTHNLTGMKEEIEVTVDSLRDKLFIFQVYPAQRSTVSYKNGDNKYNVVETDEKGRIAIFERSGIKGDVVFTPEYTDLYREYILENDKLRLMQQSPSNIGLYPQNNIVFEKANYGAEFYVWRVDSKGKYFNHNGDVTIKGGVYRNGVYCPEATINGKNGKEEQLVSKSGFGFTLKFDQNQFVNDKYDTPITPKDEIEYVFEVGIPGYYSQFVKVDNEHIRLFKQFLDNVPAGTIFLKSIDKSRIENGIGIISKELIIGDKVTDVPKNIIIEDISKSAYINTYMTFKGDPNSSYNVKFLDNKNNVIVDSLNTEVESYEFSDTIIIKNTFDLQQYVSNLELGEVRNLSMQVTVEDDDGLEIINLPSVYNVSRLNGISNLSTFENELNEIGQKVKNSIKGPSIINSDEYSDYIKTSLSYLSGFSLDSDKLRLEITPTDNPLVFKGVMMMGVGEISKYLKPGVYSRDKKASQLYDYMPEYETYDYDFIYESNMYMNYYMSGYGSNSKKYGGGAYFDCEIFYDIDDGEWKIVVLKSFIHIGGAYHYKKIYNTWIGPVPVTAEFLAGGTGQLNLKTVSEGSGKGNTYITEFNPYIYIRGFGGVGRDYEIVSFKAGVYGKASLNQQYLWLNSDKKNSNGQRITLAGETGIEYEIKLVVLYVDGTYEIGEGSKTWTFNDYNNIKKQYDSIKYNLVLDKHMGLNSEEFEKHATFEDRSYLANERYWNSNIARKSLAGGTNIIQSNAYPYSNPVLSTDGEMMIYISDMDSFDLNETSVCYSVKSGGVFSEGTEINASNYIDTDAVIDGKADGAAVTWTRVITDMEFNEGSEATLEDIQNMISSTEIMAGIYDGSEFVTTRLTNNSMADMTPVVATNGESAIVAWRSFQAGDIDRPLTFDGRDNIMYRIYDGSKWSEEKCLYDGSIDMINTFNAKMLSDGTSAITYEVTIKDTQNTEIYCAIIDKNGDILKNIRLSNNEKRDENPNITSVIFPDENERFVIGWSSFMEENTDDIMSKSIIRVVAIDGDGYIYTDFDVEIEGSDKVNYSNFKFTKGSEDLQDLSIVWVQPEFDTEDNYSYEIFGRKFLVTADSFIISISPEIKLLALDENISIDFYDAYVDNKGKISFMLQTTNADEKMSNIIYEHAVYENKMSIEQIYYNRNEILPGNEMPFMFQLYNKGIEPITNVSIDFEGKVHEYNFGEEDYIMPGEYRDINILYSVPETIADTTYSITAKYSTSLDTDAVTGKIELDTPDVGIFGIEVIKEAQRERMLSIMLHNSTFSKLREGKHTVKLYVYDSPDLEATPIATETISDEVALNMINNGIFSQHMLLNEEALQGILNEQGEIPDEGAQLFFKVAIEEYGEEIEDSNLSNNWDYAKIRGLMSKNMERVSLTSRMKSQSGQTSVQVELTNNSMNDLIGGNIVVNLKNESGRIIQSKQFGDRSSLIVGGEETISTTFDFNIEGTSFDAFYIGESPVDDNDDSDKSKDEDKPKDFILPFRDVKDTDWFYDAIRFVLENGLMVGTGADTFEPESLVTRGMLVTILHRLESQPPASNGNFKDVMPSDYYYDAVSWAQQNGIILGIDESKFGPNERLTREQFATILYRYYLYKNNGAVGIGADLYGFEDGAMVSEYALPAMHWAVGEGLIKGRGENTLAPKGNATRAETAVILQRFIEENR